ncbi:MAG: hypothetical protein K8H88_15485 [Sandaracinaceae bacterium]|nr:hypothetical protein [Sandaracinaceae bacterium]
MTSVRGKMAILIAEQDSDWGDWLRSLRCEADDVIILLQRQDEGATAFATRVRGRIHDLRDGEIVAAALVGGEHFDDSVLGARSAVARAIVAQMAAQGRGQLFLDGGVRSGRGRHAMQALANVVFDQVAQTGVQVFSSGVEAFRRAA